MRNLFHVIAQHPDKRRKGLLVLHCKSAQEVQLRIEQHEIDADSVTVFHGGQIVPVRTKTLVIVGEEPKRRGRPLGSKDKKKRVAPGSRAARAKIVGDVLEAKPKKKAKGKIKAKAKKVKTKGQRVKSAVAPSGRPVAEPARSPRAKETQADRNARLEA